MECKFDVGQRVVCIAMGDWSLFKGLTVERFGQFLTTPHRGQVLTIRSIYKDSGEIGLRFMEIHNPICPPVGLEYGFPHWEFAPLNERKTDISVFTKMLTDNRVPA